MNEIGGYFGLEKFSGKEFYPDLIAVNNARNALLYILKARKISKLYIPYFLCDSVESVCKREGFAYEYYHIDKNFLPIFHKTLGQDEYLYIVNFYGLIDRSAIINLKKKFKNIILDNVQAFFDKPIKNVDTVYSCRKFFGVPDGGYVSTDATLNEPLEVDVSMGRMRHILGRFEGSAREFFADFKQSDEEFDKIELRSMSKLTHNILSAIDYDFVKAKRESNFKYLHKHLGAINILDVKLVAGPYAYPFYCENGHDVRKALADKNVFIATLWPNVLDCAGTLEKDYAQNILPLPCDQRYNQEDMKQIVDLIKSCKIAL